MSLRCLPQQLWPPCLYLETQAIFFCSVCSSVMMRVVRVKRSCVSAWLPARTNPAQTFLAIIFFIMLLTSSVVPILKKKWTLFTVIHLSHREAKTAVLTAVDASKTASYLRWYIQMCSVWSIAMFCKLNDTKYLHENSKEILIFIKLETNVIYMTLPNVFLEKCPVFLETTILEILSTLINNMQIILIHICK